jgi:hypothetical protein
MMCLDSSSTAWLLEYQSRLLRKHAQAQAFAAVDTVTREACHWGVKARSSFAP